MLNAQDLKAKINDMHIVKLLNILGARICFEDENQIISTTVCHHGQKPKLYYYKDTSLFKCYTDCGDRFDVIELVCRSKGYSFIEAINWICIQLEFTTHTYGFGDKQIQTINDWTFINNIRNKKKKKKYEYADFYDSSILNIFQKMYCQDWIDEGISIESMYKYNILYSTLQQKIIIPHYDINNRLMGVRTRATIEEEIETYGKYTPFQINKTVYSHPLSQNLYGLNINKDTIKKKRKVLLVEAEKSVLQCDTMFGDDNFTVALCGSGNFTNFQRDLILSLGVNEVIIGLDKQFMNNGDEDSIKWSKHISEKFIKKLSPYCITTVLWDTENILPYKASPSDCGKETLLRLMDNKIYVGCM